MTRDQLSHLPYAAGAILLGIVGLVVGDFALQWQPVAKDVPMRTMLAYAGAVLLIAGGAMSLLPRAAHRGVLALAVIYAIWTLVLHLPRVATHLNDVSMWLGLCEIGALSAAGFAMWATADGSNATATRKIVISARVVYGLCAMLFGLSHFVYAKFTATMVPSWLPFPLGWAYATGIGHAAAGLALVSGIPAPVAALMHALMMGAFVVLLHVPRVIADSGNRVEWTMLGVALSLSGAAWGMSRALRSNAPA